MLRRIAFVVLVALAGVSCSRDPEVVKRKYLQNGNRYFEKGKYKEAYIMYRNALKKDAKFSEAYYRAGLAELRMEKPVDALRDFNRAIDTDPRFTNIDARIQVGNILLMGYLLRDRPPSMRADLKKLSEGLLAHSPNSAPALRLSGYLKLTADNDPQGAIEQFHKANQVSPSDPDIVLPLVESLLAAGQTDEAEKLGKDLIQKRKTFLPIYDVLYMYYARSKRLNDAEEILKLKAANNPKDADSQIRLAQFYYLTQRRPEMQGALNKLSSNPKDFPDGRLRAGRFYATIRDFDTAIRQFQDGVAQEPARKSEYRKEIAQVMIAQNRKDEASRLLTEVLKADPKDGQAQALRASLLIETGDPRQVRQAIADLQAAVGTDPGNVVLRFNLGRALLVTNQFDQARVQFQEALKLRREYNAARLALAQIHMVRHEYANAIQEADAALEFDKRSITAKLIRTASLAAMGNNNQARGELDQVIKDYPNSPEAILQLASLDVVEGRYKEAEDAFLALHKTRPQDLRALMGLTESYAMQSQFGKAADALRAELAKQPGRLELRNALGNICYRAGDYDLAIKQYQAIIQARPDAADVYVRLGKAYAAKGDVPSAVRTLDKARELKPNDVDPYLQIALLYERTGKEAQARPLYERILKLQPDHPVALNNLAYVMAETGGDLNQALTLAQRARQKMPDNADIADTLGWIYIKKNLSDNAVGIYRDLIVKRPQSSTFRYHLAMALYQRGDKPQARKELQGALERKPSPEETVKIKELLGRIG